MDTMTSDVNISVCICTFRRASVAETINSVFCQKLPPHMKVEVIVCDDDPEKSALPVVSNIISPKGFEVRYICCGSANVAVCRNECLNRASGEWIYFVDDDQVLDTLCL